MGENPLTQSLFYNKVLNSSCNIVNPVLKLKNQNGCLHSSHLPRDHMADWELCCAVPAQQHNTVWYRVSLTWGKTKIQNVKYGFY